MSEYSLEIPQSTVAALAWLIWFAVLLFFTVHNRDRDLKMDRKTLVWLAVLSLSVLVFTPFLGIPLKSSPLDSDSPKLLLFGALPWLVAGGILGVLPAVLLAGLSGLLTAYLQSHHVFTPLIFMTVALIFSLCIRQRYRTLIFKCLRFPLAAAVVGAMAAIPLQFLAAIMSSSGSLQEKIVAGISTLSSDVPSFGGMVVIGGVLCVFVKIAAGSGWGRHETLKPGPGEKSLRFRVLAILMFLFIVIFMGLLVARWISAETEVRRDAIQELTATSSAVSEGLSIYINNGEDLIARFASDDQLATQDPETVSQLLAEKMGLLPYFEFMAVLNINGEVVAASSGEAAIRVDLERLDLVSQWPDSGASQVFTTLSSAEDGTTTTMTNFLVWINDPSGTDNRILMGQTRFEDHFVMLPAIHALESFSANDGIGQIIDSNGALIYQRGINGEVETYTGNRYPTATFIEGQSLNGQAVMQYYRPAGESGWAVVTSLPIQTLQLRTLERVYPSAVFGIFLIFLVFIAGYLILTPVDKKLRELETAVVAASSGNFEDSILNDDGQKNVMNPLWGSVRNLIATLQEYHSTRSDLLTLNKQLSDQLSLDDSLKIILLAALERGLSSARILITDGAAQTAPIVPYYRIGLGEHTRAMAPLDEDILSLTQERGALVLRDFQIGKLVKVRKDMPHPASLIALPLEWEGSRLGVFWGTFHHQRHPETDDFSFFRDLSKRAALIINKTQAAGEFIEPHAQLEVVLNALDDPVLISDSYGRIVFHNRAAQSLIGRNQSSSVGKMVSTVFQNESLRSLLREAETQDQSMEIQYSDGNTYHVVAHPTQIDDKQTGVVVLFKDVTPYKMRDSLKNEFVTTVSHELRSPLTLIHGYAKILHLTGNLNEQQDKYVQNIVESVEEMRALVENLLSLSRLEGGEALALSEVTADEVVQTVVKGLEAQAGQKNIDLSATLPEFPIHLEADSAFLQLALKNLVDNAIKFTKMGGDVSLKVRRRDNNVLFEVQDTGIGIAPLDQRHIFDKFHSVSLGGEVTQQGSGLGLAIVKSIAQRHQGKVWVESQLGKGSTFYLQIPIKQA